MHSETGTRLMWKGVQEDAAETVMDLNLKDFVNKEAVIVHIPKEPYEEINPDDIYKNLAKNPDYHDGDAVIIHTGWGDKERCKDIGDAY